MADEIGLLGRSADLEVARDIATSALAGSGGVLVVTGDAGIGKSTLVACLAGEVTGGAVVGRALLGSTVPARALAHAAVAAVAAGADPADPSLRLQARGLNQLLGRAREVGMEGPGEEARVDELGPHPVALAGAVLGLVSLSRAGMLVLEDLHWADPETLDALACMADLVAGHRLLVVAVARPAESRACDQVLERLGREPRTRRVALGPLSVADVGVLARACTGGNLGVEELRRLVHASGGNPLVVEQLCASGERPAGIAESVMHRVRNLGSSARTALGAGAVLGPDFEVAAVARATKRQVSAVERSLEAGVGARLLEWGSPGRCGFVHALVHEAVVRHVGASEANRLAEALAAVTDPADHELQARLASLAGRPTDAAEHHLALADQALLRGALAGALGAAETARSLDPAPRLVRRSMEIELTARALAGDVDRAWALGEELMRQVGPDELATERRIRLALARAAADAARWSDARAQLVGLPADPVLLALEAHIALGAGEPDRASDLARRTLEAAARATDHDQAPLAAARCEAYEVLGRVARMGDLEEAERWFRRASATALDAGLLLWRARAHHELATLSQLRRLEVDELVAARRSAEEAAAPGLVTRVDFHLAAIHGVRFEADLAAEAAGRVLASSRRLAAVGQEAWGWILLGQAEVARGRFTEAERAGSRARALQPNDPEIEALDEGTCRGLADLLRGDRKSALSRWVRSIDLLRPLPRGPLSPWMLWPLVAAVWGGDTEQAMADTDHPALLVSPGIEGIRHLATAVTTARVGGSPDDALAIAARCFERAPAWSGYRHIAQRLVAEAALDDEWAGSYGEPQRWLTETEAWADEHQLPTLAAQCRALSRRAGGPVRRRGRGASEVPPDLARRGVTSREMDVLALLSTGRSNQAIAEELYIAVRTVKTHVESLLRKTGSTNRVELAALLPKAL